MANSSTESWGQSNPSTAFLLKSAKEKEKLRSKLRKELQEQMLFMLEEGSYSDILLNINSAKPNSNVVQTLPAHQPVLKVRTPAFLDHVKKNEENNNGVTSYHTNLAEAELKQFLKKAYTDDDIRRHECEVLRLSRTYADIFREGKNLLNKHIIDSDDFDHESLNSESFVTPKTSPITPDKLIHFTDMFYPNQTKIKNTIAEGPLKLNCNTPKNSLAKCASIGSRESKNRESFLQSEFSDSEFDITHDDDPRSDLKNSQSALLYTSAEMSSTSIDIDESDFMMEDICSSANGEIMKAFASETDDSNMQVDLDDSPITSGMVRSGTFDLNTQAPLEDYIENNKISDASCMNSSVDSSNNTASQKYDESVGFFLHDPMQKVSLFKGMESSGAHNVLDNGTGNNVHFPQIDGSITDSGFMSYSTFSMLSDGGVPNSFSSSLVFSSDNTMSPESVWKLSEGMSQSNLESSKKLSGSMFPFYIDINNLPEKTNASTRKDTGLSIVSSNRSTLPKNAKDFIGAGEKLLQTKQHQQYSALNDIRGRYSDRLTKAQSTPHLVTSKDRKSIHRPRPRSCYMYIDLDTVQPDKNEIPRDIKRAPSSISMFVDLSDDLCDNDLKLIDSNLVDEAGKNLKVNSKVFGSSFEIGKSETHHVQRRKLSDSFLHAHDHTSSVGYCSLRRPGENMSDSALHHIVKGNLPSPKYNSFSPFLLQRSKSMPRSPNETDKNLSAKRPISKWMAPIPSVINIDSGSCKKTESDQFSDGKTMATLLNEILHVEKKQNNHLSQDFGKKDDFTSEAGLLPMSPILRRKTPHKEIQKPPPTPIHVKASTKPQDIVAMTFPIPDKEEIIKGTYKIQDNINSNVKNPDNLLIKCRESEESSKIIHDNVDKESLLDKSYLDSVSRSESSAPSTSIETSSSGKLLIIEPFKEGTKSPISYSLPYEFEDDAETIYSEVSDLSSSLGGLSGMASFERKWREGARKDPGLSNLHSMYRLLESCSKLGEDLLRMFLEEINTDVTVEADNRTLKAHRCILSSRCKYFAAILKEPHFVESGVINLQGFSYASVHFALCHIYSGAINLPKDMNIIELSLLADVLHLDSLVDVIILHLKTHFCHFFHKPCTHCIQGVLECLSLTISCGFHILRDKCIRWLGRYFTRTWPNKVFAALPEEVREFCLQSTVKNLTVETVIEMTLNCDRLITTMPHSKWSEPVFGLVTRLLQECIHFMANNFNHILCSEGFLVLGKGQSWNVSALEDDVMSAVELMTPDIACKSSVKLSQILSLTESGGYSEYGEFTQNFIDLLHKVNRHCERYLIHNANKVVHCQSWACLSPEVQKRIRDAAVIVFEFEKPTAKPPRLSSLQRKLKKQKDGDEPLFFESATYPKSSRNGKFCDINENHEKKADHDLNEKKIVSPITEESQVNCLDSRKEHPDAHDEDSLREMQDLPHDHSQNVYLDVSQPSSSGGLLESEENHSGTQCSDNPDSLDANEMSDSKEDVDCSLLAADDISHDDRQPSIKSYESDIINNANGDHNRNILVKTNKNETENCLFRKTSFPHTDDGRASHVRENSSQRITDISHNKKSPVKSLVPLPKSFNIEKESIFSDTVSKDLVAEIDADSRMVTHCLQEAEMLEQQLSRKLLHQQQSVSTPTKVCNQPVQPVIDSRRSQRMLPSRVHKSNSSSQVKNLMNPARGKSPGKLTPSPSSPHVPRLLRPTEMPKEPRSNKKSPSPKVILPGQKSYRVIDGLNVTRQISPSKRLSSRASKSKLSSNDARAAK